MNTPAPLTGGSLTTPPERWQEAGESAKKISVWRIGKRQWLAMLVGIPLFGILNLFLVTSGSVYVVPALVVLLFFGCVYGPWVGLGVGGVGSLIASLLASLLPRDLVHLGGLYIEFGFVSRLYVLQDMWTLALAGFLAGLSLQITKGRYHKRRAIVLADSISVGVVLVYWFLLLLSSGGLPYFGKILGPYVISSMVYSLLILPVMLLIYARIVKNRKRA